VPSLSSLTNLGVLWLTGNSLYGPVALINAPLNGSDGCLLEGGDGPGNCIYVEESPNCVQNNGLCLCDTSNADSSLCVVATSLLPYTTITPDTTMTPKRLSSTGGMSALLPDTTTTTGLHVLSSSGRSDVIVEATAGGAAVLLLLILLCVAAVCFVFRRRRQHERVRMMKASNAVFSSVAPRIIEDSSMIATIKSPESVYGHAEFGDSVRTAYSGATINSGSSEYDGNIDTIGDGVASE